MRGNRAVGADGSERTSRARRWIVAALTWLGAATAGWWLVLLVEQVATGAFAWRDVLDAALLATRLSVLASVAVGMAHLLYFLTRRSRPRLRWLLAALATCALGSAPAREQAWLLTSGDRISQHELVELVRVGLFVGLLGAYVAAICWHLWGCASGRSRARFANVGWATAGVLTFALLVVLIRRHLTTYGYFAEHLLPFAWIIVASLVYAGCRRSRVAWPVGTAAFAAIAALGGIAWLRGDGGSHAGVHLLRQPLARYSFGALTRHETKPRFDFTGMTPSDCPDPRMPAVAASDDPRPPRGNIVLISVDTLRRDVLDMAIEGAPIAPNLRAFRDSAIDARKAVTAYPATILALASAFTGLGPSEVTFAPRAQPSLFELTRTRFDDRFAVLPDAEWFTNPAMDRLVLQGTPALRLPNAGSQTGALLAHLEESRRLGRRTFAWIHYFEPHQPYERHPRHDFGESTKASYASEVATLDEVIGRLLTSLREHGWFDDTLVIVFSDHGEGLGEQGYVGHHVYLNSWMTDIPLYVHAPGTAPTTIDEAVDLRDVAATVLDFAGVPLPSGSEGRSLLTGDWSPKGRRLVSEAFPIRGKALFAAVDTISARAKRSQATYEKLRHGVRATTRRSP